MKRLAGALASVSLMFCASGASAQFTTSPAADSSRKWEIIDNSFLVEESFNQETDIFQNIFTWTRGRKGHWTASFTQEWPLRGVAHQFSYTLPFSAADGSGGVDDLLVNYRNQLLRETDRQPAIAPRISAVLPTGRGNGAVGLQVNVAVSKQFGDLYVHANAGGTWLPGVALDPDPAAGTTSLTTPQIALSGILRVTPMWNLMLEAVAKADEEVQGGEVDRTRSLTISPGFRRGWNVRRGQVVVGAAVPVSRSRDTTDVALLTYFSYELPFR